MLIVQTCNIFGLESVIWFIIHIYYAFYRFGFWNCYLLFRCITPRLQYLNRTALGRVLRWVFVSELFPTMTFLYWVIISALCTFGKLMWFQGFEFFLVFCTIHAIWSWYSITNITNRMTSSLHGLVLVHRLYTLLMPGPRCMQIAKHFLFNLSLGKIFI